MWLKVRLGSLRKCLFKVTWNTCVNAILQIYIISIFKKKIRLTKGTNIFNKQFLSLYLIIEKNKLDYAYQCNRGSVKSTLSLAFLFRYFPSHQETPATHCMYMEFIIYPHQTWKIKSTCVVSIHCSGIWLECPTCSGCTWRHYARCPIPLITKSHRNVHLTESRGRRNAR